MKLPRPSPSGQDYSIHALQRGLAVLDALLEAQVPLTLEAICTRTGMPKSTAFRVVTNLVQSHYLVETAAGYWLSLKLLHFGSLVESKLDIKQQAAPLLARLRDQVNETVHLAALDSDWQVVYLDKLPATHAVGLMISRVGLTAPLHCTALGRAIAAFLPEEEVRAWLCSRPLRPYTKNTVTDPDALLSELQAIRLRGYAVDNGEYEAGVRCVAAPIRNYSGDVLAALSVSGPEARLPMPLVGSVISVQVVRTAQLISQAMGYTGDAMVGVGRVSPADALDGRERLHENADRQ